MTSPACRDFWTRVLDGCEIAPIPVTPPATAPPAVVGPPAMGTLAVESDDSPRLGVVDVHLPRELSEALMRIARQAGVPLKHLLLAVHLRVVQTWSGADEVITGLEVNGRPEQSGGEWSVGQHLNTVPFRLRVSPGTWRDSDPGRRSDRAGAPAVPALALRGDPATARRGAAVRHDVQLHALSRPRGTAATPRHHAAGRPRARADALHVEDRVQPRRLYQSPAPRRHLQREPHGGITSGVNRGLVRRSAPRARRVARCAARRPAASRPHGRARSGRLGDRARRAQARHHHHAALRAAARSHADARGTGDGRGRPVVRGAARASEPPGAAASGTRHRTRRSRRGPSRALLRPGDRAARGAQSRRGVCATGLELPSRSAAAHGRTRRRAHDRHNCRSASDLSWGRNRGGR